MGSDRRPVSEGEAGAAASHPAALPSPRSLRPLRSTSSELCGQHLPSEVQQCPLEIAPSTLPPSSLRSLRPLRSTSSELVPVQKRRFFAISAPACAGGTARRQVSLRIPLCGVGEYASAESLVFLDIAEKSLVSASGTTLFPSGSLDRNDLSSTVSPGDRSTVSPGDLCHISTGVSVQLKTGVDRCKRATPTDLRGCR